MLDQICRLLSALVVLSLVVGVAANAGPRRGDVIVSDEFGMAIRKIDPASGAHETLASEAPLSEPGGLAQDVDGSLVTADCSASSIQRVDPISGQTVTISSGGLLICPSDVDIEPSGMLVVSDFGTKEAGEVLPSGFILRIDPVTGEQSLLATGPDFHPSSIARGPSGELFVVSNSTEEFFPQIVAVDPDTGGMIEVSSLEFLVFPFAVAVSPGGMIHVADIGFPIPGIEIPGSVIRIDPATGEQEVLWSDFPFSTPNTIAVAEDGSILVGDSCLDFDTGEPCPTPTIFRLEASGGEPVVVASGPPLVSISGILQYSASDGDGDGVIDVRDNCSTIANAGQQNGDQDAFGNTCDADFNNDGVVNFGDLGRLRASFFTSDPVTDLDGNGIVNFSDLAILKRGIFKPPGPGAMRP